MIQIKKYNYKKENKILLFIKYYEHNNVNKNTIILRKW